MIPGIKSLQKLEFAQAPTSTTAKKNKKQTP
jgi:hypothetical protein